MDKVRCQTLPNYITANNLEQELKQKALGEQNIEISDEIQSESQIIVEQLNNEFESQTLQSVVGCCASESKSNPEIVPKLISNSSFDTSRNDRIINYNDFLILYDIE